MYREKIIQMKRRYRQHSSRTLSVSDLKVLDFLWTWKVATHPMLKDIAYPDKSHWWVYKALRQLKEEKYIQLLPRGKHLEQELWALTENGFEVVLMDRDDISHYRYKPHAPAHDYLATTLQLGELWQTNGIDKNFLTEQMLASLSKINFPESFQENKGHVPDGISILRNGPKEVMVAYEVDLNLKDESRYGDARRFLNGIHCNLVVWLTRNLWIAERIQKAISFGEVDPRYAFILLDDFKKNIWGAKVVLGATKGLSVRNLHSNLMQIPGKETPKFTQKNMTEIFFPKFKSPQKLEAYTTGGES